MAVGWNCWFWSFRHTRTCVGKCIINVKLASGRRIFQHSDWDWNLVLSPSLPPSFLSLSLSLSLSLLFVYLLVIIFDFDLRQVPPESTPLLLCTNEAWNKQKQKTRSIHSWSINRIQTALGRPRIVWYRLWRCTICTTAWTPQNERLDGCFLHGCCGPALLIDCHCWVIVCRWNNYVVGPSQLSRISTCLRWRPSSRTRASWHWPSRSSLPFPIASK